MKDLEKDLTKLYLKYRDRYRKKGVKADREARRLLIYFMGQLEERK